MVFDPFPIDGDVTFEKMKARLADQIANAIILHVHAWISQSVADRMRLDRWWPIKPLTPRMRILFMLARGFR